MPNTGTNSPSNGTATSYAAAESAQVELHGIEFAYAPQATPIVQGIDLSIAAGTFFTLIGPSGSGKTTLLKLLGGYLKPRCGSIWLRQREVTPCPPEQRNLGMVFQQYALFPHRSAWENVAFGLRMRRRPEAEIRQRVEAWLDRLGIAPSDWQRKPDALSGGQQQRIALARALVIEPDVLLLDEPLAHLDRRLREQFGDELRSIHQRNGGTTWMVTHDPQEAMALSDRIGVIDAGRLLQVGTPEEVYGRPCSPSVASLLGEVNLLSGSTWAEVFAASATTWGMIRPEQVLCGSHPEQGRVYRGVVQSVAFLGSDWRIVLHLANGQRLIVRGRPSTRPREGENFSVTLPPSAIHRFADGPTTVPSSS